MQILNAKDVAAALPYDRLIDALDAAFASDVTVPQRVHLDVPVPGGNDGTLLLMPAWAAGRSVGVKVATVFPDNATRSLPAVFASYFLMKIAKILFRFLGCMLAFDGKCVTVQSYINIIFIKTGH